MALAAPTGHWFSSARESFQALSLIYIKLREALFKHSAPPVTYPIRRSSIQHLVLLGLSAAGLLSSFHWIYSSQRVDWRTALSFGAVVASGLLFLKYHRRPCGGDLVWDGLNWRWASDGSDRTPDVAEQSIEVILDFQHLIVLKTLNDVGAQRWVIAQRTAFPERWLDFRRAIYCLRKVVLKPIPVDRPNPADAVLVAVSAQDQRKPATRIAA